MPTNQKTLFRMTYGTTWAPERLHSFDGPAYDRELDQVRLNKQIRRVYDALFNCGWMTLSELEAVTHDPQPSISAQIRHLRKARFGAFIIEKRRRDQPTSGLWEYRLMKHHR